MTKKKIHIDAFFRRGLGNMQIPVSDDDFSVMQGMLAQAQKRRKRRIVWFWLLGLALLAGGAGTAYSLLKNEAPPQQTVIQTPPPHTGNGNAHNNTSNGTANRQETVNSTGNTQNESTTQNTPAPRPKAEKGKGNTQTFTRLPKYTTTPGTTYEESSNANPPAEVLTPESTQLAENTSTPRVTPDIPAPVDENEKMTEKSDSMENVLQDTVKKEAKDSTPPAPPPGKPLSPFSIRLHLGPAINTFGLSNTTTYGRIRNAGDQPAVGFNGAVSLNYQYKTFELSAGIGINSIGGRGNYNYSKQVYDSVAVLNPQGQIIGYFYKNFRDTSLNYSLQNRFTYITLPVAATYMLPLSQTTGLRFGLGLQLGYLAAARGEYINPANLYKFDAATTGSLFNKWMVSGRIEMGGYYKISNYITMQAGINYTHTAGSMLGNGAGVAVRPRSIGFEAGIKFNLTQ